MSAGAFGGRSRLQVEHDLAQQHVLERGDRPGAVDGVVALEGLVEVGVGRLPVLLLRRMDDPWGGEGGKTLLMVLRFPVPTCTTLRSSQSFTFMSG